MQIELKAFATSYGSGPYYPAINANGKLHYWPNITCETEEEAFEWASLALKDAYDAANAVTAGWNVYQPLNVV